MARAPSLRLFDLHLMDRVGAAPKMDFHRGDVAAITFHLIQLAVDVVANPRVEHQAHDDNGDDQDDQRPEPFSFPNLFHDAKRHRRVAPINIRAGPRHRARFSAMSSRGWRSAPRDLAVAITAFAKDQTSPDDYVLFFRASGFPLERSLGALRQPRDDGLHARARHRRRS